MKKYKFEIILNEGCDEFWEDVETHGDQEVQALIEDMFSQTGFRTPEDVSIKLIEIINEE